MTYLDDIILKMQLACGEGMYDQDAAQEVETYLRNLATKLDSTIEALNALTQASAEKDRKLARECSFNSVLLEVGLLVQDALASKNQVLIDSASKVLAKILKFVQEAKDHRKPYTTMTLEEARDWLIGNDAEASDFWKDSEAADLVDAVGQNLRDFGDTDPIWKYVEPLDEPAPKYYWDCECATNFVHDRLTEPFCETCGTLEKGSITSTPEAVADFLSKQG